MISVKKKVVGNQTYYYLEHSYRENDKILKKEKYLGGMLPKNLEKLKKDFIFEIYKKKWFEKFDKIKEKFLEELKKTPESAKEKQTEAFSIRFTYDTQRTEGSKLTLRETSNLLEKGITPKTKPLRDVKEAEAHQKIFYEMLSYEKDLSLQTILYFHKKLFESTSPDIAGKKRQHQVIISGSKFVPPFPAEINPLIEEFFSWYNKNKDKLHPVELAALTHLRFVTIHPFADGNGRISRLLINFVLHKNGFPMLNIPYEKRAGYYGALERAQTKKEESIFLNWLFKRYLKENGRYLK